ELQGKIDVIPGHTNTLWLKANEPGTYRGQCAEYCGLQHANMAFYVIAQPPDEFQTWLAHENAATTQPADPALVKGQQAFLSASCAACHAIRGTNAGGREGPDLTHVASRNTLAAGTLTNTPGTLGGWIVDPQHFK